MIIANNISIPKYFMRKIILIIFYCTVSGYCFCQPFVTNDSIKNSPDAINKAKEYTNLNPETTIYPNPAKNKITLQVKNFDPGMATVKVLTIKGDLVREDKRLLTNGNEDIVMFLLLKAGTYFIQVSEPGKITRKKIVIL
jgi:Secretion system C-terminal sorting domain